MARVFISYSWTDGPEIAEWLYNQLKNHGIDVFRDKHDINPYNDFRDELKAEIRKCTHLVVCGTSDLQREKSVCHEEIEYALEQGKRIIPLNISYLPQSIERWTWIKFSDLNN